MKENRIIIEYRRLTENELDLFITMRINRFREEAKVYRCGTIQIVEFAEFKNYVI